MVPGHEINLVIHHCCSLFSNLRMCSPICIHQLGWVMSPLSTVVQNSIAPCRSEQATSDHQEGARSDRVAVTYMFMGYLTYWRKILRQQQIAHPVIENIHNLRLFRGDSPFSFIHQHLQEKCWWVQFKHTIVDGSVQLRISQHLQLVKIRNKNPSVKQVQKTWTFTAKR